MESRYNDGFSSLDRSDLDSLYFTLFGKTIPNKGCSDCYRDAYIEIKLKLKNIKEMPKKSEFVLKPGAIITFFGESQCYSNANITDEAALRFLSLNPRNESLFEALPADWRSLLSRIDNDTDVDTEDKDAIIARLTEENEQLRKENESLKSSLSRKKSKKKPESKTSSESTTAEKSVEPDTEEDFSTESVETDNDEVSVETPEE